MKPEETGSCSEPGCQRSGRPQRDGADTWLVTHQPSGRLFVMQSVGVPGGLGMMLGLIRRLPRPNCDLHRLLHDADEPFTGLVFVRKRHCHGSARAMADREAVCRENGVANR